MSECKKIRLGVYYEIKMHSVLYSGKVCSAMFSCFISKSVSKFLSEFPKHFFSSVKSYKMVIWVLRLSLLFLAPPAFFLFS